MKAYEIMTHDVVTAPPTATIAEIAKLMVEHRVSAIPIVTEDRLLAGIVTESDLLHRKETSTERKRKWWVELFVDPDVKSREYVKSAGTHARDVMTAKVVTAREGADLAEIANLLDRHRIRRVAIVADGRLTGIVSRADLVRALARAGGVAAATRADDAELHDAVQKAIAEQSWLSTIYMAFVVRDGRVLLTGFVELAEQHRALKVLVESVPGVRGVDDHLQPRPVISAA